MFITRIKADAGDRSPGGSFWFEPVGLRTQSGVRVTASSSMTLPAVLACVRVLAESFAIMPFMLYRPKEEGGRLKERGHWLYRLIAKAPNRFQTPYEWRLMMQGHLALRGNAFNQIIANSRGEILELLPLHPDRMAIELLAGGSYRYVYTDQNGVAIPYGRHEIWHLRGLSDDGYMGLSLIALAREAIGEGLALQSYSSRFFANDAKPGGGWIEYPGFFATKDGKKTFRDSWQEMQGGANRGKVAVLERGMKFHELGLSNKDSQFIEARGAKTSEIARIFRIPPHKIMDLERSTNNNIEHQGIEFWTDTMLPWAKMWESSISYFLLGPDEDLEPDFDHKPMMRGDGQARAERISKLVSAGVMLRNEGREEEGYDPIDGLNEPLRPLNMVNESQADQQPSAAAPRRMAQLLRGNAGRMARRILAGQTPTAEVLADALALDAEQAQAWLDTFRAEAEMHDATEESITASLATLGETA
jgi:HK97 family phage portal protein